MDNSYLPKTTVSTAAGYIQMSAMHTTAGLGVSVFPGKVRRRGCTFGHLQPVDDDHDRWRAMSEQRLYEVKCCRGTGDGAVESLKYWWFEPLGCRTYFHWQQLYELSCEIVEHGDESPLLPSHIVGLLLCRIRQFRGDGTGDSPPMASS